MKVVLNKKEKEAIAYPCLMESEEGNVVLIIRENCGFLLVASPTNGERKLHYSTSWHMPHFKNSTAIITISND